MEPQSASPLETVKALWRAYERHGYEAVIEALDPEVDWTERDGRVHHGRLELQAMVERMRLRGVQLELRPYSFEQVGEWVIVTGGMRTRSRAGLADTQRCWAYRVEHGRPVEVMTLGSREEALRAVATTAAA